MATPAEINELSRCFRCVGDFEAALLYLLATNAGIMDPAVINANSTCYRCVADFESAALYLLDSIATAGAATAGQVTCGSGAPTVAPPSGCGVYYDTDNDAVYIYRGGAWQLKV